MDHRILLASPRPPSTTQNPLFLATRLRPHFPRVGSFLTANPRLRCPNLSFVRRCHADGTVLDGIGAASPGLGFDGGEIVSDDGIGGNGFHPEPSVPVASSLGELEMEFGPQSGVEDELESHSIWEQMKEILVFAGPATGLWICGPLMSLIDTAVIGQSSSLELAALGPGTVFCDNLCYIFMFLSIATSNMVATALAKRDKKLAQHQISMLLFVALGCGLGMLFFTRFLGTPILAGFIGSENFHILPASSTYIQIRGLAWPAVLVGMVAQSASLGMKDSWGPLKALAAATVINGFGDIILCSVFGFGIAGAAWATMVSQVVAAAMMIQNLNKTGYNALSLSVPSGAEIIQIIKLAAPVFVTMTSKVAFYSLLTYFATSMGVITVAAHQVMINVYCMCTVWGEPLSQTAQSFMPEMLHGVKRNLAKARMLLKSLVIIGALTGLVLGAIGTSVPWVFPSIFTNDGLIVREMHKVLIPYFIALMVTPSTHSLEGTLLAGRDLGFLSLSMSGCFSLGGLLLLIQSKRRSNLQPERLSKLVFIKYNKALHERFQTRRLQTKSEDYDPIVVDDLNYNSEWMTGQPGACNEFVYEEDGLTWAELVCSRGYGFPGCWWTLAAFQWARFSLALQRLTSPHGMLYSNEFYRQKHEKVKAI